MLVTQDPLLAFKQFGFKENGAASGNHVRGQCPFCGKEDHFYINVKHENKVWDCKKCGRSGGFQNFLREVADFAVGKNLAELSQDRGLSEGTLLDAGVGYMNNTWIVPVWDYTKEKLLNIKIYDGSSFRNTAGCSAAMYGLWMMPAKYDEVFVTEGEWDYLALKDAGVVSIIGAPGAGTFKTEVIPMFLGKRAYLLYDNDEPGRRGQEKVANLLLPVASEVRAVKWPENLPDGYDVRDAYKTKGSDVVQYLISLCIPQAVVSGQVAAITTDMKPLDDIQEAYKIFHKWLLMPDDELLDVIFGTILANRIPGDPVWMFIVAPPGGTKSEPLMTLSGCAGIETLSSMTPATLISGHSLGGTDPSLIPMLDQKTLVIKDYTVIMGLPAAEREEIQSILRDAYDGECKRVFANGITRKYKSKFGIIAGVTPAIETYADENTRLGERFLRWRNWIPTDFGARRKYIERALANVSCEVDMRLEMATAAKRILLADYTQRIPSIDKSISNQFVCIADWVATMRGVVTRDRFRHNALYKPTPELGTRLCKELIKLFMGISMLRGKIDPACFSAVKNVARSSVNIRYLDAVSYIYKKGADGRYTLKQMQEAIGLSGDTTSLVLDDLVLLKVLKKEEGGIWMLTKNYASLTHQTKIFN